MQREFPTAPIAGVGAVVLDTERRVLLVRRGQPPLLGEWSLPGGALELGERLEDGIRREVREETGLDVEPEEIVAVFDHISHADDDPARVRFHYVLVDYRCSLLGGTLASATDATAMKKSSLVATTTRLNTSRPIWSVPNQCRADGPCSAAAVSLASGS